MATTNANESRAMDNFQFDLKSKKDYLPKENYRPREAINRSGSNFKSREYNNNLGEHNYRQNHNTYRSENNMTKPKDSNWRFGDNNKSKSTGNSPKDNSYRSRGSNETPIDKLNSYKSKEFINSKPRDFQKNFYEDKDEDSDHKKIRSHKSNDSKPKSPQDQPLDKIETIKRLEREKKVMQKKLREEETEKSKRPVIKQKKNSKSDWTKDYIYGLLEEDDYDMY